MPDKREMSEDLTAEHKKIDALTTMLESLQEFVLLNVGATPVPAPRVYDATNAPVPTEEYFCDVRNNTSPRRKIISITTSQNRF